MSDTQLNFIAYKAPGKTEQHLFFAEETGNSSIADFCIRPFEGEKVFFKKTRVTDTFPQITRKNSSMEKSIDAISYKNAVKNIVKKIGNGELSKVVLSRVKHIEFRLDLPSYFDTLCEAYPEAFVCLTHTRFGTWIGASPEVLLQELDNKKATTHSLAGTCWLTNDSLNEWSAKEIQEQALVSREIESVFNSQSIPYKQSPVETIQSGNLLHLKSTFTTKEPLNEPSFWRLAEELHPTPAVAGTPTKTAIEHIKHTELHSRALYTGYWGFLTPSEKHLFVNLRCMQVFKNSLAVYVGGGITKDSNPEREWQETEQKANNLLQFLAKNK